MMIWKPLLMSCMMFNFNSSLIKKNAPLIVAVSGGPDSVALLHMIKKRGFKNIVVAHLDHQIRSESYADAQLVQDYAHKFKYDFELRKSDIQQMAIDQKENLEALGRDARYKFFRELKENFGAAYIVTAHHADDQVETVLMNIIRGCGIQGLGGMKEHDGDLWRPLLNLPKQALLDYCLHWKLQFIREPTNEDLNYRRNFLRAKVVPHLKQLNPNFLETMRGNVKIWQEISEHLESEAREFLRTNEQRPLKYDVTDFVKLDEAQQKTILRCLFEQVHGHKKDLAQDHLEQVLKVLRKNVSGKQKEFGPGAVILRGRGFFEVKRI